MSANIKLEIANSCAIVLLEKKPLNILSIADIETISAVLEYLNTENKIKAIVLKSAFKDFSAGMDINEHKPGQIEKILASLKKLTHHMLTVKYPTISLIKGACLGGAMEIVLLTDIILASENTKIGFPEIKLAHMAPIAINILPEIVGSKRALELILTGNTISAEEALTMNLITQVYKEDVFDSSCEEYVNTLTELSQAALLASLKAFRKPILDKFNSYQNDICQIYLKELINHPDATEGISAFKEKRAPKWEY